MQKLCRICENSHIFAHLRICDRICAAYFAYLPHISAHYFAKFRIFSRIFCIKTARIFYEKFPLYGHVFGVFFTAAAKSDDPLSHPNIAPHKMVCLKFEPACKSSIPGSWCLSSHSTYNKSSHFGNQLHSY